MVGWLVQTIVVSKMSNDKRIREYRLARKLGATASGAWFSYNELIERGLVECWQDNGLAIVEYPKAIRRRLSFDCFTLANNLRNKRYRQYGHKG